jgi:hypothetical protein
MSEITDDDKINELDYIVHNIGKSIWYKLIL